MFGRKKLFKTTLMLLMLLFPGALLAQYAVSGRIAEEATGDPLPGAHVYLMNESESILKASISDEAGKYRINNVSPGSYTLRFSYVGFAKKDQEIIISSKDINSGKINMAPELTDLGEVNIKGRAVMATQLGDTTQFNAEAFTTMPDATAEELVEKLPGVIVEDGKVEAMGEEVKQVLVDGRPFFRNDPTAALKTLPAEVVDKIQVFDKESDQAEFTGFSDGQTEKTMNIITHASMRNGVFGKVSGGLGYEEEAISSGFETEGGTALYAAGGNLNYFNDDRRITLVAQSNNVNMQNFSSEDLLGVMSSSGGRGGQRGGPRGGGGGGGGGGGNISDFMVSSQPGITKTHSIGLNYSDLWGEKTEITASYFFNYSDNASRETLHRLYTVGADSGAVYDESSESQSKNINHRFNMRLEHKINDNNSIFIRPRLSIQQNTGLSAYSGETWMGDFLLNELDNTTKTDYTALDFSNTFLYRHKFQRSRRTLSVNATTAYNNKGGECNMDALTAYYTDPQSLESIDDYSTLDAMGWTLSGNIMYTEPLGANGILQLNYLTSYRKDDSDIRTFSPDPVSGIYDILDTLESNIFNNNYITQKAGAGYSYRKDKLFFNGRLEYQSASLFNEQYFPSEYNMSKNYRNVLGSAMMRYRISDSKNINLRYRTSTSPPSISQLQEVVDNSNPVQLRTGNPNLEQTYSHSANLRYSSVNTEKSRVFFAMLSAGITDDYIANHTLYASKDTLLENGLLLKAGSQLISPVNLDGYLNLRSFITYGIPVDLIRSNLNFNLGYSYVRNPGMVNEIANFSNNNIFTGGVVIGSNISEYLDFTLSSRSSYNIITNSNNQQQDYNYLEQRTRLRGKAVLPTGGWLLESNLTHKLTSGLSESYDQNNWIWSAAIGKKLFKSQLGEIKLGLYDILNQGQSINRSVSDIYVEDVAYNVIQRYFMLTFTYNLRQFKQEPDSQDKMRDQMRRNYREMN